MDSIVTDEAVRAIEQGVPVYRSVAGRLLDGNEVIDGEVAGITIIGNAHFWQNVLAGLRKDRSEEHAQCAHQQLCSLLLCTSCETGEKP